MLKGILEILSLDIKNIIDEAGFQNFSQALLNQDTHEYKVKVQKRVKTPLNV